MILFLLPAFRPPQGTKGCLRSESSAEVAPAAARTAGEAAVEDWRAELGLDIDEATNCSVMSDKGSPPPAKGSSSIDTAG